MVQIHHLERQMRAHSLLASCLPPSSHRLRARSSSQNQSCLKLYVDKLLGNHEFRKRYLSLVFQYGFAVIYVLNNDIDFSTFNKFQAIVDRELWIVKSLYFSA